MNKFLTAGILALASLSVNAQSMNNQPTPQVLTEEEKAARTQGQEMLNSPLGQLLYQTGQLAILTGYYEGCSKYDKKVVENFEKKFFKKGLAEVVAVKGTKEQFDSVYSQSKAKSKEETKQKSNQKDCEGVKAMLIDITKKMGS